MFPPLKMKRTNNKSREKPENLEIQSIKRKTHLTGDKVI